MNKADMIKKVVAINYEVPVNTLSIKSRETICREPRQVAMSLIKHFTKLSYVEVGKEFGGYNHATVIHACRVIRNYCATDKRFRNNYNIIMNEIDVLLGADSTYDKLKDHADVLMFHNCM